jgi:hypothetical protein
MIEITGVNETYLDDFKPGYADLFIRYFSRKFDWTEDFTRLVTRDALRFLELCALPAAGQELLAESRVMVCSPVVDKIVDAIFLDSPLLAWLEKNVFDEVRVLHVPYYAHGESDQAINNAQYEFTIALMLAAGYELDRAEIWPPRLPVGYLTCGCNNDLEDCKFTTERG